MAGGRMGGPAADLFWDNFYGIWAVRVPAVPEPAFGSTNS
jgi:hypothetical protein